MEVLNTIQENVRFRVNSLRAMVVGSPDVAQAEPLQRRKEIVRRRRNAVTGALGDGDGTVDVQTSNSGSNSRGSGQISDQSADTSPTRAEHESRVKETSPSSTSRIPSMSETNRGTVERARERGYGE